jgi:hypothetical protein
MNRIASRFARRAGEVVQHEGSSAFERVPDRSESNAPLAEREGYCTTSTMIDWGTAGVCALIASVTRDVRHADLLGN